MVASRQQQPSPSPSPQQASPRPPTLERVALAPKARGVLVGETGSGKSTLAEALITHWRKHRKQPRILIIDSKPRFRGEWELNGFTTKASKRYKGMDHGAYVPGSYVLPLHDPDAELKQVWRLGGDVAIAQVDDVRAVPALEATMHAMYREARSSRDQLVYIDELPDFFGSSPSFARGHGVLKLVRSGREKGIAVLAGAQRPRNIPPAVLTETTNLYMFYLANDEDWKHLKHVGLPKDLRQPTEDHVFVFYNKAKKESGEYRLKVER